MVQIAKPRPWETHSSHTVWVPKALRLIVCQNKVALRVSWAAVNVRGLCISEGESSPAAAVATPTRTSTGTLQDKQCLPLLPTQSLSAIPSPAAPRGCALPPVASACCCLTGWTTPQLVLSCLCVSHHSPRKGVSQGHWSSAHSGVPVCLDSHCREPSQPSVCPQASWQMTSMTQADLLNYSILLKELMLPTFRAPLNKVFLERINNVRSEITTAHFVQKGLWVRQAHKALWDSSLRSHSTN